MALQDLCSDLALAKSKLSSLQKNILKIENEIISMIPPKLEGSQTIPVPGYRLTTTHKVSRKLDFDAYQALNLPKNMQFVDMQARINLFNLRSVERRDPAVVAQCVTVKPAKTSIKIEEVDE